MKVIFELRKEKATANGLIPIQFVVRAEGVRIRKNVGFNTKEIYWTGSRVKPNLKKEEDNNYQFINDELQKIESKVNDIFFFFRANKLAFSKQKFLEQFEAKKDEINSNFDFFDCFEEYLTSGSLIKSYMQKTAIVYHLQRIKVSIAQRLKVNHLQRVKVNH